MDLYLQIFFTTLALAFAMIHFFLFFYNSDLKTNLYFATFLVFYALNIFFDYQTGLVSGLNEIFFLRLHRAVAPFSGVFGLLFTYSILNYKLSKQFWIISAGLSVSGIFAVYDPQDNFTYLIIVQFILYAEIIRLLVSAILNKKENILIISSGFFLLFIFSMYDMLMDFGLINGFYKIKNGYPFGFLALIITISIHLARNYAQINKKVLDQQQEAKEKEISRLLLEAEDKRKTHELDEARRLQLSLLPDCAPTLSKYDICFDMKTASEVGGDYYDYLVQEDGSITIAIGDATGHGMKAGIMVSIIKSLFLTHALDMDIPSFFNRCSQTIKSMHLNNLYMAMMLVKIHDYNLITSSAGIPPIMIYRCKDKSIEEIITKGMPLGAFETFDYQTVTSQLFQGDIILLMTDGLAELFNENKEEFGFQRISQVFSEHAHLTSSQIVQVLFEAGKEWKGSLNQNDDISLAAIKLV